jgi:hypothetical protein
MKKFIIGLPALLLGLALTSGCEQNDNGMEKLGEKVDNTMENAADRTEDAVEEADNDNAIEDAAEEIDNPR